MDNISNPNKGTSVSIMDKEFVVACSPSAAESLNAAAAYLDAQMRQIRQTGRVIGTERIAVMAALNIAHELLSLKNDPKADLPDDIKERLRFLSEKIDAVLVEKPCEEAL